MSYQLLQKMPSKAVIVSILILSLIIIGIFLYRQKSPNNQILEQLWLSYKSKYYDSKSGRTIDEQREGVTTSEGQSYTMLRSLWMNDQEVFNQSWIWTKQNLGRKEDKLFSWLWGQKSPGQYGVITSQNGQNSAIDGDIDIAYSLVLASKKWNNPEFLNESKSIIKDIWTKAVILSETGKLILASNDLEKTYNKNQIVVNPSYFSTYAFREFAKITPEFEWNRLADDSYYILDKIHQTQFNPNKTTVLPPDWIEIDKKTLTILPSENRNFFGYDALRIPWRVAMDYRINKSQLAYDYLKKLNFLGKEFQNKNLLYTVYNTDGSVKDNYESLFAYSCALPYFDIIEPQKSSNILNDKILPRLNENLSYYESNWAWFSLALYYNQLN